LPSNHEALSSNPCTIKNNNYNKRNKFKWQVIYYVEVGICLRNIDMTLYVSGHSFEHICSEWWKEPVAQCQGPNETPQGAIILKKLKNCQVAHACDPSYSGGRDQEDPGLKPGRANNSRDHILKKSFTTKGWWSGSRCRPWVQSPVPQKETEKSLHKVIFLTGPAIALVEKKFNSL
jgi:hypothetical protein